MRHSLQGAMQRAPFFLAASLLVSTSFIPANAVSTPNDSASYTHTVSERSDDSAAAVAPLSDDVLNADPQASVVAGQEGENPGAIPEGDPRVITYWTTERMENAIPADNVEDPQQEINNAVSQMETEEQNPEVVSQEETNESGEEYTPQTLTQEADEPETTAESVDPVLPEQKDARNGVQLQGASKVTNFSHTNGKIFYTDASDGKNYVCSGAAINTPTKRTVVTAGHCVHGGKNKTWHRNIVFVPGYNRGVRPHGTFSAQYLRVANDWVQYGQPTGGTGDSYKHDVAFIKTNTNEKGQLLVNMVGGHGLNVDRSPIFESTVFAYPGNKESGTVMHACWGNTHTIRITPYYFPTLSGCEFAGGSSGGPWLADYNNATGLGKVQSVTSFATNNNTSVSGAIFDRPVWDIYQKAAKD